LKDLSIERAHKNERRRFPLKNHATDVKVGLTAQEVALSRKKYGKNELTQKKSAGFFRRFLSNLNDPMIRVLIGALCVSALLLLQDGSLSEVLGIACAIFLSTFVSTASEYRSERAFAALQAKSADYTARVLRDGRVEAVPFSELVVGDIVFLQAGDQIPADGEIVSGEIALNFAALNGESKEQARVPSNTPCEMTLDCKNALLRGADAVSGECKMQVMRVGDATMYGSLAKELQSESIESPLKTKLSHLARVISRIGYLSAILVVIADLIYSFFICQSAWSAAYVAQNLLHAAMLGITVIVVCVPEGLPMMITVVLSSNMFRMMKNGVFVRKGIGIETAGGVEILFCDKTGTLTCGEMKLQRFLLSDGKEYATMRTLPASIKEWIALNAYHNTSSVMSEKGSVGGNAVDRLLLDEAKGQMPNTAWKQIAHHPFSSQDKYSYATLQKGNETVTLIKGAPELLLPHCTYAITQNGARVPFTEKDALLRKWQIAASAGTRVIAIALSHSAANPMTAEMDFLSFVLIGDHLRKEARASVEQLHRAGVQVVMMTGDHEKTARAIAQQCGILQSLEEKAVLSAHELAKMDDEALAQRLPHLRVIYRARPEDKSRLVKIAQAKGIVVGMTGDGLNDAPALKNADVGFAMGTGSDVAREAADIVVLDNNIASIVRAVWYGRTIFQSIRKFILFQLTMNFCAVIVSMIAPFIGIDTPITVMQMLWINLIMDTLAGLAFAGESPDPKIMGDPPLRRTTPVLTKSMATRVVSMGSYCVFLCMAFLKSERVLSWFDYDKSAHMTGFFTLFVFCGIFCAFHARCAHPLVTKRLWQNHPFLWIMTAICAVQIAMVYFGGSALRCVPLSAGALAKTIALAASVLPMEGLRKALFYFLRPRSKKEKELQKISHATV
jgi:calcium-translocating P-type ATPase